MIALEEAWELITRHTPILEPRLVPPEAAAGRILAETVTSPVDLPPYRRITMDGFALRAAEAGHPLTVAGEVTAGTPWSGKLPEKSCLRCMTGGELPKGCDAVVKVEDTEEQDGKVVIKTTVQKGDNWRPKGEDIRRQQTLLKHGSLIGTHQVAMLAATGIPRLKVRPWPRVNIITTGGEFVRPGEPLGPGQIYNANGPQLQALLGEEGIQAALLGEVPDDEHALAAAIHRGLRSDIFLLTGGVSMGSYDLVPRLLQEAGVTRIFHKVKVKPGKPLFFGVHDHGIVFGLPGNPVSAFTGFQLFVMTAVRRMMGYDNVLPEFQQGVLLEPYEEACERRNFVPVRIQHSAEGFEVVPVGMHSSGDMVSLGKADGMMMLPEETCRVEPGTVVDLLVWRYPMPERDLPA